MYCAIEYGRPMVYCIGSFGIVRFVWHCTAYCIAYCVACTIVSLYIHCICIVYCIVLSCLALHGIILLHLMIQYLIVSYHTEMHSVVVYCIAMFCIVLHMYLPSPPLVPMRKNCTSEHLAWWSSFITSCSRMETDGIPIPCWNVKHCKCKTCKCILHVMSSGCGFLKVSQRERISSKHDRRTSHTMSGVILYPFLSSNLPYPHFKYTEVFLIAFNERKEIHGGRQGQRQRR